MVKVEVDPTLCFRLICNQPFAKMHTLYIYVIGRHRLTLFPKGNMTLFENDHSTKPVHIFLTSLLPAAVELRPLMMLP